MRSIFMRTIAYWIEEAGMLAKSLFVVIDEQATLWHLGQFSISY